MSEGEEKSRQVQRSLAGLSSSLALRVLLVSFVFLVIPLIFYSFVIYDRDYHRKMEDIFATLDILEQDHIQYIRQLERFELDFVDALHDIVSIKKQDSHGLSDQEVDPILRRFANHEKISALFYLGYDKQGNLVCQSSTIAAMVGKNYSQIFSPPKLAGRPNRVKFGVDPIFGPSLFFYKIVFEPDSKNIHGVMIAAISLDQLLEQLASFRVPYDTTISILSKNKTVIASTQADLFHQHFRIDQATQEYEKLKPGDVIEQSRPQSAPIVLKDVHTVPDGYVFRFNEEKQLAELGILPDTSLYLLLSVPSKVLFHELSDSLWRLLLFIIFLLVIGGIASFILSLRMSRPLKRIGELMFKVGHGEMKEEYTPDALGFELNYLGEACNEMTHSLSKYIEEVKEERAQKEAYGTELRLGHTIQMAFLPITPLQSQQIDVATKFFPAKELGGDFYDWEVFGESGEERILFVISDGVGKGMMGCFYAFDLRCLLRSIANEAGDLHRVVTSTNQLFCHDTKESGIFVTAFVGLYDVKSKTLQYINCGHNPPYLKKKAGDLLRLEGRGMALGVDCNCSFEVVDVDIATGDTLVMYTDGITEAENLDHQQYSEQRLKELIQQSDQSSPGYIADKIIDDVRQFVGSAEQHDDMTLLVIHWYPKDGE